jgi:hypothetical protein
MTKEELIDMAKQSGFVDYELDDGTTNAFDKRYEAFAKLVAEKAIKEALAQPDQEPTYTSTQATNCAGCGERKHTPLRIDSMGGYVCLTCIDKKLSSLLGEFGYEQQEQEPVAWEQFYPDLGKPQIEQPKVRTGDCLLVVVCASKGHKIQKAQPEQDNTYIYASSLATAIWQKHYMKESPKFELLDTIDGVLTQIDNMTFGLVREKPAQPEQEPVAWISHNAGLYHFKPDESLDPMPLYLAPSPCPTCEALARTVMLDQTSHDAQRKPLSDEQIEEIAEGYLVDYRIPAGCAWNFARDIEAFHGIKE